MHTETRFLELARLSTLNTLLPFTQCKTLNWMNYIQRHPDLVQIFFSQQQTPPRHMGSIALALNPDSLLSAKSARRGQPDKFNPTKARVQYPMGISVGKCTFFFPISWP